MRYLLEVSSRALPGRDDEYNEWYESTHIGDILKLPGINSCQRYVRANTGQDQAEYVAVYEVETDDPAQLLQSLFEAGPKLQMSDAIDLTSARFDFLRPMGERRTS